MMSGNLQTQSDAELVKIFVTLALAKAEAIMATDTRKVNRLYPQIKALNEELRARDGDHRRLLLELYNHPNPQVRLEAAMSTLTINPEAARRALQLICDREEHPYALDAGMTLYFLDRGEFIPD